MEEREGKRRRPVIEECLTLLESQKGIRIFRGSSLAAGVKWPKIETVYY